MTVRDLWAFESGPAGVSLSAVAANWTNYTGHTGQVYPGGQGGDVQLTSDGWASLTMNPSISTGAGGISALMSALGLAYVGTSGIWIGFRARSTTGTINGNFTSILSYSNGPGTTGSVHQAILSAAQVAAAGGMTAANVSNYFEVFLSSSGIQVWMDGKLIATATTTYTGANNTWYLTFGMFAGGVGAFNFQIRDVYFLDVDSTTPGRLGAIQGNAAPLGTVTGSEWLVQPGTSGDTTLEQAISTPLNSTLTTTPNILSPADKQALVVPSGLPSLPPLNSTIFALQYYGSIAGNASAAGAIQVEAETSEGNLSAGTLSAPSSAMVFNQKLPFMLKNPAGNAWSVADITNLSSVLTPQ